MLKFSKQIYYQGRKLFVIDELVLHTGQLIVLFGANGTGKSTWLKSIVNPTANDYELNNKPISHYNKEELAQNVAFVDNNFRGLDHLRVSEYIALGRFPYTGISGRLSEVDIAVIDQITMQLHITHLLEKSTSELSDGERQRCNIARALIQETPVVLLDEPTSFLDFPSKIELFKLLNDISLKQGKLVIVSTHDIEMGLEFGTQWCIINKQEQFVHKTVKPEKTELLEIAFNL